MFETLQDDRVHFVNINERKITSKQNHYFCNNAFNSFTADIMKYRE